MDPSLKQRLIGATVVVSLIVIFVPMLFDEAPEEATRRIETIPALPEAIEERPISLPRAEAERAMEAASPPPSEVAPKPEVKPKPNGFKIIPLDEPVPRRPQPEVAKPAGEPIMPPELPAESASVGAAGEPAAVAEAPPAETRPVAEPVAKPKRMAPAERVPAKSKPAAAAPERVKSRPAESAAIDGNKSATGKAASPRKAPKGPPATWIVQTGSFTGESNAKMLVERLRKADLPAYVETSKGDSGTLFRVQVGPELNRGRAEQIQKQIERSFGIKGMIVTRD